MFRLVNVAHKKVTNDRQMSNAGSAAEENAGNATETHYSLCIPITDACVT